MTQAAPQYGHGRTLTGTPKWIALIAFIVVVQAVGSFLGITNAPGVWYAGLDKPFFNPPNWIFGPVWTVLYLMVAIAGWRVFQHAPKSPAMGLWVVQMLINWIWTPVFFGAENLALALVVIVVMLAAIFGFMFAARRVDTTSTWLFAPYAAWVSFATLLNASLLVLNG